MRAGKQLLNQSVQLSIEDGLRLEERLQRRLIGSANQVEAVITPSASSDTGWNATTKTGRIPRSATCALT